MSFLGLYPPYIFSNLLGAPDQIKYLIAAYSSLWAQQ